MARTQTDTARTHTDHTATLPLLQIGMLLAALYAMKLQPALSGMIGGALAGLIGTGLVLAASFSLLRADGALQQALSTLRFASVLTGSHAGIGLFLVSAAGYTFSTNVLGLSAPDMRSIMAAPGFFAAIPVFALVISAAFGEELLFRGVLHRWLGARAGVIVALLAGSAIFAVYHLSLFQLVPTLMLGLGLAVLRQYIDLWAAVIAHVAFNGIGFVLFQLTNGAPGA